LGVLPRLRPVANDGFFFEKHRQPLVKSVLKTRLPAALNRLRGRIYEFGRGQGERPMNYPAFTNDSLTMMYEGIRGALAADEALKAQGAEARFRVRETPDWKKHASELETEMLKRGMFFEVIDWSEDQARLPFGE
jgi:hypothetical protein